MIVGEVERTLYEATTTKSGRECLVVSYYLQHETVKQWLFPGSATFKKWWGRRSAVAPPSSPDLVADMARKGYVKPTKSLSYERDGKFNKIVADEVGEFPKEFFDFLSRVTEVFGEVETIRIIG